MTKYNKAVSVCFSGHRSVPFAKRRDLKQCLKSEIAKAYAAGFRCFYCGMAMGFADAEVAGQAVRTENGIMLIACNGLNYMDNVDPSKSWHIMYSINDTDMYKKIMNAMTEGYIIGKDIENVSKWEKYFEEKELSYERILSDEELELLQMNKI